MARPLPTYPPEGWSSMSPRQRARWLNAYTGCTRKRRYVRVTDADDAAANHHSCGRCEDGLTMRSYPCRMCRGWHVGHRRWYQTGDYE
jgi:hypothetical protein